MHSSEQRGKLLLNGKPMPTEVLARHLALDKQRLEQTLENLLTYGVASIDEDTGALINRRMVKDEHIRQVRKEAGAKGGNPNLLNQNANQKASKQASKNQPLHLSSSSSNGGKGANRPPPKENQKEYLDRKQREYPSLDVRAVFQRYTKYCHSKGIPLKRPFFDNWLDSEFEPLTADFGKGLQTAEEKLDEQERFKQENKPANPAEFVQGMRGA